MARYEVTYLFAFDASCQSRFALALVSGTSRYLCRHLIPAVLESSRMAMYEWWNE